MSRDVVSEILRLGAADDLACVDALAAFDDPELVGEVMVELYRCGTSAARAALAAAFDAAPFGRGYWQGFKRIFKLAEASQDAETLLPLIVLLDAGGRYAPGGASFRTRQYMQRRCYRLLKRLAHTQPATFRAWVADLVPRYPEGSRSVLLPRLLRVERGTPLGVRPGRFAVRLENPFREGGPAEFPDDLLELDSIALTRPLPEPDPPRELPAPPPAWRGPIFPEVWTADPRWLVGLLLSAQHGDTARALATLLARISERLHEVPLDAFYALLEHPQPDAWRLGLAQLAARARHATLRYDAFVGLFSRAAALEAQGDPDWDVLADLLWALDAPAAESAREQVAEALRGVVCRHPNALGVGPLVDVFARHLPHRLGPPLFDWPQALALLGAERPDVRELGRTVALALGASEAPSLEQRAALLTSPLARDDADAVVDLLSAGAMAGAAPPEGWPLEALGALADELPAAGFACLERALWRFEDAAGLSPEVGAALAGRAERRTRGLGLALLDGAAGRGALDPERLAELAGNGREDVVVWARERIEALAAEGTLPNPVLYRLLDAATRDVRGFGRELVREHLERFEIAELIVFCAESPDAPTAALGIELYRERAEEHGFDLVYLLPLFRILLYRVASARREKERIYASLTEWALESAQHGEFAASVVAAFGRSRVELDFARALQLLVKIKRRFPEAEVGVEVSEVFGHVVEAS
ncbi:MAG: hypothetical protein KDD82_02430 [Planctomycetes bacterium]|nr:hypothetical protein [Planctomycetota bacterium]